MKAILLALGLTKKAKEPVAVPVPSKINPALHLVTRDLNVIQYQELLQWLMEEQRPVDTHGIKVWRIKVGLRIMADLY